MKKQSISKRRSDGRDAWLYQCKRRILLFVEESKALDFRVLIF